VLNGPKPLQSDIPRPPAPIPQSRRLN